jgi:hypothetical protein
MASFINTDLATGELKGRVAKILFEKIMRMSGSSLAGTNLGGLIEGAVGSLPDALKSAIGIGGAAILQSPYGLAQWISRHTGGNADQLHELFNEGLDSMVTSFMENVKQRRVKNPDYDPSSTEMETLIDGYLQSELTKRGITVNKTDLRCIVNSHTHTFHHLQCPECWRSTSSKSGKDARGDDAKKTERILYRDGCRDVLLRWALENGYAPTKDSCCGKSAAADEKSLLTADTDLRTALRSLKPEERAAYLALYASANDEQRKVIDAAVILKMWAPGDVKDILEASNGSAAEFVKRLPSNAKPQTAAASLMDRVKKAVTSLIDKGPDAPEVKTVRETIGRTTSKLNKGRMGQVRKANRLEALLRRR